MSSKTFKSINYKLTLSVVAAVILLAGGFYIYSIQNDKTANLPDLVAQSVPEIKNTDDLGKAESNLQQTDIDKELDTSEIDEALTLQ